MKSVIPTTYFFEFTFQAPKRVFTSFTDGFVPLNTTPWPPLFKGERGAGGLLRSPIQIDGNLDNWSALNLVPDLMHLKGTNPFAQVYFSWDDDNIYIGLSVSGKKKPVDVDTARFWRKDCLEVWLDLRNDKTRRRYSEHCHHFFLLPRGRKENNELATAGECREPGGLIQETIFDYKEIEVASIIGKQEYSLEARIPRSVIPTYDPINHPTVGFNYHLNDVDRRAQWWSCGPDFPRHLDPSTWGSVELIN